MAKPDDFLLNTDYEMDKIIFAKTGSFTGSISVPHSLGYEPLAFGVWSTNEDFSTSNSLGLVMSSSEQGYTPPLGVGCRAYTDHIQLTASGQNSGTTKIYFRLFAFEAPGERGPSARTSNLANEFILNTDYNYRKLKKTGTFNQTGQEYQHDLGYLPQIMAWVKYTNAFGGGTEPMLTASNATDSKLIVTNNKIRMGYFMPAFEDKVIWRIYYDKAQ